MPKVSVLTPLYNTNPIFLREMIKSMLNQTFSDFEFIIVNDSPDNNELADIVMEFNDPRIRFEVNEKNLGISGKLFKKPCCQAEWNKNVPFGFS